MLVSTPQEDAEELEKTITIIDMPQLQGDPKTSGTLQFEKQKTAGGFPSPRGAG